MSRIISFKRNNLFNHKMSGDLSQSSLESDSAGNPGPGCATTRLCTRITPSYASLARLIYGQWQYYDNSRLLAHVREAIETLSAIENQVTTQLDCNPEGGYSELAPQPANSIEVVNLTEEVNSL